MNKNFLIEYKQVPMIRVNVIKFKNSLAPYFEQTENEYFLSEILCDVFIILFFFNLKIKQKNL